MSSFTVKEQEFDDDHAIEREMDGRGREGDSRMGRVRQGERKKEGWRSGEKERGRETGRER